MELRRLRPPRPALWVEPVAAIHHSIQATAAGLLRRNWRLRSIQYPGHLWRHGRLRAIHHSREHLHRLGRDGRLRAIKKRGLRRDWRLRAVQTSPSTLLWDDKLAGATLATRPRITNINTTALAVGFIAISCFWSWARLSALRPYRSGAASNRREAGNAWQCKAGIAAMREDQTGNIRMASERSTADVASVAATFTRSYCGTTASCYSRY